MYSRVPLVRRLGARVAPGSHRVPSRSFFDLVERIGTPLVGHGAAPGPCRGRSWRTTRS